MSAHVLFICFFNSLFYLSLHSYVVLSNASVFNYFFSFIFSLAHH